MLITDWKSAWKFFSVQASAVGISALFAYTMMYERMEKWLPPKYMMVITLAVFVLVVVGRVTRQNLDLDEDSQ